MTRHTSTWMMTSEDEHGDAHSFDAPLLAADFFDDGDEAGRLEAGAADEGAVDVGLLR